MSAVAAPAAVAVLVVASAVVAAGCGSDASEVPADAGSLSAAQRGELLVAQTGCTGCHRSDAKTAIGPGWGAAWDTQVALDDGRTVAYDEAYVTTAVRDPNAERREGSWIQMPTYGTGQLSDGQLADIIEYLRSLGDG